MTPRPIPRNPLLTGIAFGLGMLYLVLFWAWAAVTVTPMLVNWLSNAGSLNACTERGLMPDECAAYAQEARP